MNEDQDYMGYTPTEFKQFEILPVGTYDFVIHGIVGLGLRATSFTKNGITTDTGNKPFIKMIFEIPEHKREDGQSELLTYKFTISSSEKSYYYKFCNIINGSKVNDAQMKDYCTAKGMKTLLGKKGTLTVEAWTNQPDKRSVSKTGFYPLHPKVIPPEATRDYVFFNPYNPDLEVFEKNLTAWTRKEIMEAENADEFSEDLHALYIQLQKEDMNKQAIKNESVDENKENEKAPWDTGAIQ